MRDYGSWSIASGRHLRNVALLLESRLINEGLCPLLTELQNSVPTEFKGLGYTWVVLLPDKSEEGIKFLWHKFTSFPGHTLVTSIKNTVSLLLNCTKTFVSFLQDNKGIKKARSNSGGRDAGVSVSFTH